MQRIFFAKLKHNFDDTAKGKRNLTITQIKNKYCAREPMNEFQSAMNKIETCVLVNEEN